ncbi:MAG: alpha/beta hydrolase-fold protein [Rhodanobacter sp.]
MRSAITLAFASAFFLPLIALASSQEKAPVANATTAAATIESSRTFDFISKYNGEEYRVNVYLPRKKTPTNGYPALFVLDGNALFGTFAEAMRNRSMAGEIESAVIVGIASGEGDHGADRTLDFTSTDMSTYEKSVIVDLGPDPPYGGSEKFYRVVEEEIKPRVAAMVKLDQSRSVLFGWSLGGLFVVHTMFEHPASFKSYIAISPSLWRNNKVVFKEIPGFEYQLSHGQITPRLFVGVGSLEEKALPGLMVGQVRHDQLAAELRYCQMVSNTKEFAHDVGPYFSQHNLAYAFKVFDGDTHNSVPWSAINPVLDFAFPENIAH